MDSRTCRKVGARRDILLHAATQEWTYRTGDQSAASLGRFQEDITERRKAEQKIAWLAHHDPLTSAANRAYFSRELDNALHHLNPESGFAVHWIDLEKFKEVNDTLGHPVGDALLKSIVRSLRRTVRGNDLVARLGGDEFAVIQAGVTAVAEAERLTKRLLAAIRPPRQGRGHDMTIAASIGVVLAPHHGSSAEELMEERRRRPL